MSNKSTSSKSVSSRPTTVKSASTGPASSKSAGAKTVGSKSVGSKSVGSKSASAFRTISEVATQLGVPKHVLRFWEGKFPQVKPMKRGGGRRYYRPEDIDLLQGIRTLLHSDGYTIKGVQKILREQGVQSVKERGQQAQLLRDDARDDADTGAHGLTSSGVVKSGVPRTGATTASTSGAKRKATKKSNIAPASASASSASNTHSGLSQISTKQGGPKGVPITSAGTPIRLNAVQRDAVIAAIAQLEECRNLLRGKTGTHDFIDSAGIRDVPRLGKRA